MSAINALIVCMTILFVVSAVFPDYTQEQQSVNIEEADMDGQESNEEKKENKEKDNFHESLSNELKLQLDQKDLYNLMPSAFTLQELCLPVITPPPDQLT